MAQLLKDSQVGAAIEELIDKADDFLWLLSPYIKLHERIKDKLKTATRRNPGLQVVVIFGKNEDDMSKSISKDDVDFLKSLPDIFIGYEARLHAKFYASEDCCIITSMNLHQFSQNNNLEVGIKLEGKKFFKQLNGVSGLEKETLDYFEKVIENSKKIYASEAQGKSSMFGLRQEYSHSEVKIDETDVFFKQKDYVPKGTYKRNTSVEQPVQSMGYCIRTGKPIPFNPKIPMSKEAYNDWAKYKNIEFKEKFCHYSGEPSNGETTISKPILRKNWNKAQEMVKGKQ